MGEGFEGGSCQANGRPSPVIRSRCRSRIVFRISVLVAFAWHASLLWSFCAFALVELLAPLPCQFSECLAFSFSLHARSCDVTFPLLSLHKPRASCSVRLGRVVGLGLPQARFY